MNTQIQKLALGWAVGLILFGHALSARADFAVNITSISMPSNLTTGSGSLHNSGLNLATSGVISSYSNSNHNNAPFTFTVGNATLSQASATSFGPQMITALAVTENLSVNGIAVGAGPLTFDLPALAFNSPGFYEVVFSTFTPQTFAVGNSGASVIVNFSGPTLFSPGGSLTGGITETLTFVQSPEPSSMLLMGLGALLLPACLFWRRERIPAATA